MIHRFILCLALCATAFAAGYAQSPPDVRAGAFRYFAAPAAFVENRGQWPDAARFLAQFPAVNLWVTADAALMFDFHTRLSMPPAGKGKNAQNDGTPPAQTGEAVRLTFGGKAPRGGSPQTGKVHYIQTIDPSRPTLTAPLYSEVNFTGKHGETLRFSAENSPKTGAIVLTATFPSAEIAAQCTLKTEGTTPELRGGAAMLGTTAGTMTFGAPQARQPSPAGDRTVAAEFILNGTELSFRLGDADPARPIIVAVPVLFSAVAGGAGDDECHAVALDTARTPYITGATVSADFPTTAGAYSRAVRAKDCFVAKFNGAGNALMYTTYLGGSGDDIGYALAVDAAGSAYIAGTTTSNDFPATSGAIQPRRGDNPNSANTDCFVAKLTPDGGNLIYATYLGGRQPDIAKALALDPNGACIIGGSTSSGAIGGVQDSFPITTRAFSRAYNGGGDDGFVAKISPDGKTLELCTYLGGNGGDYVNALALGNDGTIYATGETLSPTTFPHTPFTIGQRVKGQYECFITKFSPAGDSLRYSVLVGGEYSDGGKGITADIFGNCYVAGYTESRNFPASQGALDTAFNGIPQMTRDAFILKLSPKADSLLYSTFFGGEGSDEAAGIAIDVCGAAYIAGPTNSPALPVTPDAYDATLNNGSSAQRDAFLAKINSDGNTLVYSTFLGGAGDDDASDIAVDATGAVYVAGTTASGDFPKTSQFGNPLKNNAFLTKIQVGILPLSPDITPAGPVKFCDGGSVTLSTASNYRLYQWQFDGTDIPGATAPQISADKNGRYTVAVTDASGCTGTKDIVVTVFPKPRISAGSDTLICPDSAVILRAVSPDPVRFYRWSPPAGLSSTDIPTPLARPTKTTDYIVTVTDTNNCEHSDTVRVIVIGINDIAVRGLPDTLFVCPGDSLPLTIGIANANEAAMTVGVASSDPRFRVQNSAAVIAPADSALGRITFLGAAQPGTYSARISVSDVCGNVKTADIAVFAGVPVARTSAVSDTTVCLGETALRLVTVRNSARPPAAITISGGGGKFSAVAPQITVPGRDSALFQVLFSGDTVAGTHRATFYIDDQCGGRDSVTIAVVVKGTPLVIRAAGVSPAEAQPGVVRTVNIAASDLVPLNESPNKTMSFTVLFDKTTLVLDSVTSSQCAVSVVRPAAGRVLVRLENCAGTVANPLARAVFRTVVGETLTPAVQIADVVAGDKCIAPGASPADTVKMLPYGCEIRTLNVQLFGSALMSVYPSPADGAMTVEYSTVEETVVRITLVGALGQTAAVIADAPHKPGVYQARFPTADIPPGRYIVVMQAGQYRNAAPAFIAR